MEERQLPLSTFLKILPKHLGVNCNLLRLFSLTFVLVLQIRGVVRNTNRQRSVLFWYVNVQFFRLVNILEQKELQLVQETTFFHLRLLEADGKNVVVAVAQGIVPVLVQLLDSSSSSWEIKEKAVASMSRISMVGGSKHVLTTRRNAHMRSSKIVTRSRVGPFK